MNYWTAVSIKLANQRDYLDQLFRVYPIIPNLRREIDENIWNQIETAYNREQKNELIRSLLKLDLFPIKESYVAYLKRDQNAIERNPRTIDRIFSRIRELNLDEIYAKISEPKETNRQIGPLFRNWIRRGTLGFPVLDFDKFSDTKDDAILDASDRAMKDFAHENLNYNRNKGLDFIARKNGKYIIGEAKFLTDFGGHQDAQFKDAIATVDTEEEVDATTIGILDGVLYIKCNSNMHRYITQNDKKIFSSLVLREYLHHL